MSKSTIAAIFAADDTARQAGLDRARRAARCIKPWILPPHGQSPDSKLPDNYQSLGARGFTNLSGKVLSLLYSPGEPWVALDIPEEVRWDPRASPEFLQALLDMYFVRELVITSLLESATPADLSRDPVNFHTNKRGAIEQFLITGDTLERVNDDYTLTVFSRPAYVTKRDSEKRVLYHIVEECKDPLELTDDQFAKSDLKRKDLEDLNVSERLKKIHTRCEWHPGVKRWVVQQELNDRIVNESEEIHSPFISTPFDLIGGENYGRGLGEHLLGDLNSCDELNRRMLDFAEIASKILSALDYHCQAKPSDLTKPTGGSFRARVQNGQIQDIAFLKPDKLSDFNVVNAALERVEGRLGRSLLLDSESVRDSERTTAFEIDAVTLQEMQGATGGLLAPSADRNQVPLAARVMWMAERDKILKPLPQGATKIVALTGLGALAKKARAARGIQWAQAIAPFGEEAIRRIDVGVLAKSLARAMRVQEPGLVKTDEQIARELQAALAAQARAQAAEKAIDVAGNVAEQRATQGATQ